MSTHKLVCVSLIAETHNVSSPGEYRVVPGWIEAIYTNGELTIPRKVTLLDGIRIGDTLTVTIEDTT